MDGVEYQKPGLYWNKYLAYANAFRGFCKLIGETGPYFSAGKYTIGTIGPTYCNGGSWVQGVTQIALEIMKYYTGSWSGLPPQIAFDIGSSADLIEDMKRCMEYCQAYEFTYAMGTFDAPSYRALNSDGTWGTPRDTHIDCSGYVSWVLYEWAKANGYDDLMNYFYNRKDTGTYEDIGDAVLKGNYNGICKYFRVVWKRGQTYDKNVVLPGDIIVYREGSAHHVAMVAEDYKLYDAGCTDAIQDSPTYTYTRRANDRTYVLRVVKPGI